MADEEVVEPVVYLNEASICFEDASKSLWCEEKLMLGAEVKLRICTSDGVQVPWDGALLFRLDCGMYTMRAQVDESTVDTEGALFTAGEVTTDAFKRIGLVQKLQYLPIGTTVPVHVTLYSNEHGAVAQGTVTVLVASLGEVTETSPWDPERRLALFKGDKGEPGIDMVEGDPNALELPADVRVAINTEGEPIVIREVPVTLSGDDGKVLTVVNNSADNPDARTEYAWEEVPKVQATIDPGIAFPGRIALEETATGYLLVQYTAKYNPDTQKFENSNERWEGSEPIEIVPHSLNHTSGVL